MTIVIPTYVNMPIFAKKKNKQKKKNNYINLHYYIYFAHKTLCKKIKFSPHWITTLFIL